MAHNNRNHQGAIPPVSNIASSMSYPILPHANVSGQQFSIYPQGGMNRMPAPQMIPHAMYYYNQQPQMSEEQLKIHYKEHNYQLQQQRLRSFNASSTSLKSVNPDDYIQNMFGKSPAVKNSAQRVRPTTTAPPPVQQPEPVAVSTPVVVQNPETPVSNVVQPLPKNNKKNLEAMLLECSDLMRPGKAQMFPKSHQKTEKKQNQKSFTPGVAASIETECKSDESSPNVKTNNLGFPSWCFTDGLIPDLYRRIQEMVTRDKVIDTNLLYPTLLSSGLSRDILGHIWALVNQTTPGQLLPHELYAALTLVALAQNGYKFSGLDILQSLARPLVPYLKEIMSPSNAIMPGNQEFVAALNNKQAPVEETQEEFTEFLGFSPTVQMPLGSTAVGNRLANYSVGLNTPVKKTEPEATPNPPGDFADFQKAAGDGPTIGDDKYSIFRELDRKRHDSDSSNNTDDEFGDFLSVAETAQTSVMLEAPKTNTINLFQNIKPFSVKPVGEKSVDSFIQSSLSQFQMSSLDDRQITLTKPTPQDDENEFGDFVSPNEPMSDLNSLSQLAIKDPGSAESQSVSSLELGPVDGVNTGNDNTSFHSLDFKSSIPDDEYGDLQGGMDSLSISQQKDSASTIANTHDCLLDDPYRFIGGTEQSDIERNAQEWKRCLESCYQLIDGAANILNGITSENIQEEVIHSNEGFDYLKNIVEIYLMASRLQHSIKISGLANESLSKLMNNIMTSWTNLSSFISSTNLMLKEESLNFTDITLSPNEQNNTQACGVCLLSVNAANKNMRSLEFSGRQYHATCANFWVNCVNSLLPALTLQQQLLY